MVADPAFSAVLPWLKTLPLAPEYRPTLAEFQDPVAYILKIEQEASQYGICKIIPPFPAAPKSTAVANLNISFSTRSPSGDPTFTTRQQQIGFCPRRPFPVQKSVWQSGVRYTLPQFEAKSRGFERAHLHKFSKKSKSSSSLSSLEIESLFWNAAADKPSSVEYANDIPGSGFSKPSEEEIGVVGAESVGETAWNMRGVARAKGSLLKFMREEIPGVTSPMVYVAMLFSWFAWHVEDHDLHSLNYLHMGAGKTWYGVPRDAALAFEDVVRVHGYGGELNPLITFATLAEKTTLMSPEVLVHSGIPCCRLVQNAGEFVVTFPGSYHSGFSHGFNCGEASNIATPEWLKVAKEAAIRRASMNCPPMVSHYQLLYSLTLSLSSRDTSSIVSTPKSSRLRNKLRCVGETMIKETFVQNVIRNNNLLNILLDDCSSCLILPQRAFDISLCSGLTHKLQMKVKPRTALGLCHGEDTTEAVAFSDFSMGSRSWGGCSNNGFCFVEESSDSVHQRTNHLTAKISNLESSGSLIFSSEMSNKVGKNNKPLADGVLDRRLLPCVTCGILSTCVAVMRPSQAAARYIISLNCNSISSQIVGFEVDLSYNKEATRKTLKPVADLNFGNVGKIHSSVQVPFSNDGFLSNPKVERGASALDLLASAYGDLFDSEEDSNMTVVQTTDKESDRMHIFCLEHAVEVKKRLLALGGANLILLCHPEYPKIESEAKILAEELELDYQWKTVQYKDASEQDQDQIRTTIEDEDAVPCNGDWAVKLGLNLYYSINLSQSPLFRKQLPYNEVIRKFFTQKLPAEPNGSEKIARRQKKIILAGKWCGKVWMSNQVHPYLKDQNVTDDDDDGDVEVNPNLEAKICKWNENRTIVAKRNSSNYCASDRRNSGQKKESPEQSASSREISHTILEDSGDARYAEKNINTVIRRKFGKKQKAAARLSSRKPVNVGSLDENFGDADGDRVLTDMEEDKQVIAPIKNMTNRNSSAGRKVPKNRKKTSSRLSSDIREPPERSETDMHVERVGQTIRQMMSLKNNKRESFNVISRRRKRGWRHTQLECSGVDGHAEDDRDTDLNPKSDIDPEKEKDAILVSKNFSSGYGAARKRKRSTALEASEKPLGKRRVIEKALDSTAAKEDFPCDVEGCSMSLRTKKDLSLHKRNVCPEAGCGKRFFSHKYLLQHRKVHSDDRPLKCPWKGCKMAFKWVWARTEHIRVHTGERPYSCREPGCDLTFRFVSDFSRHRRKTGHLSASKGR